MKRPKVFLFAGVLAFWWTPLTICQTASTSSVTPSSKEEIGACHIEEYGVYSAAYEIAEKAEVIIGFEAVLDFHKESTIVLDFPGGTLGDLLNMLIAKAPTYEWEEEKNGVIHVFNRAARPAIANVEIPYSGAVDESREEVWEGIHKMPRVKHWMAQNQCSSRELMSGKEFRTHNGPISIESGHISLAQLLDDLAIKSGEKHWAIVQSPPGEPCWVTINAW